jgi:hypothetical protein
MTQLSQELWTGLVMALGRVEGAIAANRQATADGLAALGISMDRRFADHKSEMRAGFERFERDLAQVVARVERGSLASQPLGARVPDPTPAPAARPDIVQRLERLKAIISAISATGSALSSLPLRGIALTLAGGLTGISYLLPAQMAAALRPVLGPLKELLSQVP